jgi:3-(methylsulfanyl)propanoyl-CoA dehydrogenase
MTYLAPIDHMRFVIERVAGLDCVRSLTPYKETTPDLVDAVLDNAGKFAGDVLAPLNASGDREGAVLTQDGVRTPAGFRAAYAQLVADGWPSLAAPAALGGQGLPTVVHAAVAEMWCAANHAFSMCPELAVGAVRALEHHGSAELRARLLPRMVSGEWACTMCLTEPQAGSDLSGVTTSAELHEDGWRLRGRKSYISWGEHDLTENILHFILARAPGAPPGVKGLSLFVVPRFLIDANDRPGAPNDIRALSLERKMGIHASPTCVMAIGEQDGARGWLLGEVHRGMDAMFTMMNHMRLSVALQAVGIAEHACQIAAAYARERLQGRDGHGRPAHIIDHADVHRMLLIMRALNEGARSLCYTVAANLDVAEHASDPQTRRAAQTRADLLTPVVKAWCSDMGVEVTSLAVQVHGGAGFVEDSHVAQLYRDVRVTAIYEGTNGIQAQDLLGRKVLRDGGRALESLLSDVRQAARAVVDEVPDCIALGRQLLGVAARLEEVTAFVLPRATDRTFAGAVAVDYLALVGYCCVGWQWARSVLAVNGPDAATLTDAVRRAIRDRARGYAVHVLPRAHAHASILINGPAAIAASDPDLL